MNAEHPVSLHRRAALSASQRAMMASQLRSPHRPVQNMAMLVRLPAGTDPERLASAFAAVVAGSDALRSIIDADNTTRAEVASAAPADTDIIQLPIGEVRSWATERARLPIDLSVAGYDSAIAVHEDSSLSWFWNMHHVLTDARSNELIMAATAAQYHQLDADPNGRYYQWAHQQSVDPGDPESLRQQALDHWGTRASVPALGGLYSTTHGREANATRVPVALSDDTATLVKERLSSSYRAFTNELATTTLLVSTAALYAHALTGAAEVSVGIPVHNRRSADDNAIIGPLVELFPVDIVIDPTDTARSLHKKVARAINTTLRHAIAGTAPDADYSVVVNVIPNNGRVLFGDEEVGLEWLPSGAIDADHVMRVQLTGYASDAPAPESGFGAGTRLELDLNDGAVPAAVRPNAAAHFAATLNHMVSDPDAPVAALSLITEAEHQRLQAWETGPALPSAAPLLAPRLQSTLAHNLDVVVVDGEHQLTGQELWDWVCALANDLIDEQRVSIELTPSVHAVVAAYAAMIAGVPFVPIDPSHPENRRDNLVSLAGVSRRIRACEDIDGFRSPETPPQTSALLAATPQDEAYLIFTSGSTGEPKGVPITHQGLADYIAFAEASYFGHPKASPPVAPLFGSLSFDLTITTLFAPILVGGSLVAIGDTGPAAMSAIARHKNVTWCKATPSHLELMVRLLPADHQLNTFVVGGEAFTTRLAAALLAFNATAHIFNEYGPTEAVVGCMIHQVNPAELDAVVDVPIGVPAPGVTLRVVNPSGKRVPPGARGELLISHDGVTDGYLNASDQTPSPFVIRDGRRFYRSGDLVQLDGSDALVYRGRIDEQVKVGGVRLDPLEVEEALDRYPGVERSVVRLWAPEQRDPEHHCVRCGLPDTVPSVSFDSDGVCDTCHTFDRVKAATVSWFRTPDDLVAERNAARERSAGEYDCLALLSGGKDSTYALYQLVDHGFRPYAMTLDNGYISEGAKSNVRRVTAALGVDHDFVTSPAMDAIFRDSLATFSNVCNGCYKTIYTLAVNRANELDIPLIVTGLSRGQLFETRLVPEQFRLDRFDPDAIDRAVLQARKHYHRATDLPNRLLDTAAFEDDELFERIQFIDIFRYLDVELEEMIRYLESQTPWRRPTDTGRSTNCLINVAGIHTHLTEQGFHNYAVPYAWDVRLGHKTRDEAIAELEDDLDLGEVNDILGEIGYQPTTRSVLTGWMQMSPGVAAPTPTALRSFLASELPAYAIPAAFVAVDHLPMTANGKLDERALPDPERIHRSGVTAMTAPGSELERQVVAAWETALGIEPISVDDDFFAIGGDSLAALAMIVSLSAELGVHLGEELAFVHTTPRSLAAAIEEVQEDPAPPSHDAPNDPERSDPLDYTPPADASAFAVGEASILFEQRTRPGAGMYNLGRVFRVEANVDHARFEAAVRDAAAVHAPLSTSYDAQRRPLKSAAAIEFSTAPTSVPVARVEEAVKDAHRAPFDLTNGPVMRVRIQPVDDGSTAILIAAHHVACDLDSFAALWDSIDAIYRGLPAPKPKIDYRTFAAWQLDDQTAAKASFWAGRFASFEPTNAHFTPSAAGTSDELLRAKTTVKAAELRSLAGITPAAAALTAASAALSPFFDQGRVPVSLVSSTRTHPVAANLVGYMLNPLPMQIHANPGRGLSDLAHHTAADLGASLRWRDYPFARMVAAARTADHNLDGARILVSVDEEPTATFDGGPVTHHALFNGEAVGDLAFFVEVRQQDVDLSLEYRAATINTDQAEQILARAVDALQSLVHAPATTVADVGPGSNVDMTPADLLSVAEGPELSSTELILDQTLRWLAKSDDRTAAECGGQSLTWAELNQRSRALAAVLQQAGVTRGDPVIVAVGRNVDVLTAIVGVHRAGAAYVPIDPSYPEDRIKLISKAARASVAVIAEDVPGLNVPTVIGLTSTTINGSPWSEVGTPNPVIVDAHDDAYVIFTSGSTGVPSGVSVTHGQLAASTNARATFYDQAPRRFGVISSIAFDSSVVGVFWTLAAGGTVIIPAEDVVQDVDRLVELLSTADLSHILCVPSLYRALLRRRDRQTGPERDWPDHVIVAGEACSSRLVAHHFGTTTSALTNEYGPTECTVWATAHHCTNQDASADRVPIGVPVPGTWVAVVDQAGAPVAEGIQGELIIGGANVTGGYVNDPDRTAARFVLDAPANPDLPSGRYFRSGDAATMTDGTVYFAGRLDDQLNVGGARVEAGEIEDVVSGHPQVNEVVVGAVDTRTLTQLLQSTPAEVVSRAMRAAAGAPDPTVALLDLLRGHGDPTLIIVGHCEIDADPTTGAGEVLDHVRTLVANAFPPAVRPQRWYAHLRLPRTPNNKLDRAATLALTVTPDSTTSVGSSELGTRISGPVPASPSAASVTEQITAIYGRVLSNPAIRDTDSFFDVGGDSLMALELLDELEPAFGIEMSTSALFEYPVPADLAAHLIATHAITSPDADGDRHPVGPASQQLRSLVIPIQTAGDQTPVFAVHHLGKNGDLFRPLSQHLGPNQPVYGLAAPLPLEPFGTADYDLSQAYNVASIAASYVAEVQRIAPDGPVVIVGTCQGALFAYEVAQQLKAEGREVPLLIMLTDWHAPHIEYNDTGSVLAQRRITELKEQGWTGLRRLLSWRGPRLRLQRQAEIAALKAAQKANRPLPHRLRVRQYIEESLEHFNAYEYEPWDGPAMVVRGSDDRRINETDRTAGWGDLIADLDIQFVSGWGVTILQEPNITQTARVVQEALHRHC